MVHSLPHLLTTQPTNIEADPSDKIVPPASVTGMPAVILRIEGLALAIAAGAAYHSLGLSWGLFALLFLAPDLFMAGYLAGPRIGAISYNFAHTTTIYLLLGGAGLVLHTPILVLIALIGLAHVGADRALGYGLKYPTRFGDTHLGFKGGTA